MDARRKKEGPNGDATHFFGHIMRRRGLRERQLISVGTSYEGGSYRRCNSFLWAHLEEGPTGDATQILWALRDKEGPTGDATQILWAHREEE